MDVSFSIIELILLGSGKELEIMIAWYKAYGQILISKLDPVRIERIELANILLDCVYDPLLWYVSDPVGCRV